MADNTEKPEMAKGEIMQVIDRNLLPVPFDAIDITSRGGILNKPLAIDFWQREIKNNGIKVMRMILTHDVSGEIKTVQTKVLVREGR